MSNLSPSRGLKRLATVAGASILLAAPAAHASTFMDTLANVSSTYNAYTSGAFTSSGSDTEGKIAAGGAVSLSSYEVAAKNSGGNALVAGGALSFSNGTIHGNSISGGAATYSGAGVTGTVSAGGAIGGSQAPYLSKTTYTGLPLNFGQISADLASASSYLNSNAAQSQGSIGSWVKNGTLTLTSTAKGVVFFDLAASNLVGINGLVFNVDPTATVIINLTGQTGGQFGGFGMQGDQTGQTLFNFVDATSLNISGLGFMGSILAPNADLTANNGQFNGSVMAKSYTGGAQLNWKGFSGILPTVSAVPEPSSWAMMILGVGAVGAVLRKRRRDAGAPTLA